tara:strand:- start:242 stop:826 length:585 start_codon:yes stop_codon:yes gene_type:complete
MANTLEGYESVAERIEKFWIHYPMGRIDSKLIFQDGTRYIVQTDLYRDVQDLIPFATDYAEEIRSNANRFPLENCVTSSIGRALHTGGLSKFSENGNRPSYEEMRRVGLQLVQPPTADISISVTPDKDPWAISDTLTDMAITPTPDLTAPLCSHGFMAWKEGVSNKTGNPYKGWTCPSKDKANQCRAVWLEVSK